MNANLMEVFKAYTIYDGVRTDIDIPARYLPSGVIRMAVTNATYQYNALYTLLLRIINKY